MPRRPRLNIGKVNPGLLFGPERLFTTPAQRKAIARMTEAEYEEARAAWIITHPPVPSVVEVDDEEDEDETYTDVDGVEKIDPLTHLLNERRRALRAAQEEGYEDDDDD